MTRTYADARGYRCVYCGEYHEAHEDAACGCGCGSEPMECGRCMADGGPMPRYGPSAGRDRVFRPEMVDDASDFDSEGW